MRNFFRTLEAPPPPPPESNVSTMHLFVTNVICMRRVSDAAAGPERRICTMRMRDSPKSRAARLTRQSPSRVLEPFYRPHTAAAAVARITELLT